MLASVNAYCKIDQLICYLFAFFSILSKRQALRIASAKNSASWWRYFQRITTTMCYKFTTVNTEIINNIHYAKPISIVLRRMVVLPFLKRHQFGQHYWMFLCCILFIRLLWRSQRDELTVEDVLNLIYRLLRDRNIFWQCGKTVQQGHQSQIH